MVPYLPLNIQQKRVETRGIMPMRIAREYQDSESPEREFLSAILRHARHDLTLTYPPHVQQDSAAFFQNVHDTLRWFCELLDIDYLEVQDRIATDFPNVARW